MKKCYWCGYCWRVFSLRVQNLVRLKNKYRNNWHLITLKYTKWIFIFICIWQILLKTNYFIEYRTEFCCTSTTAHKSISIIVIWKIFDKISELVYLNSVFIFNVQVDFGYFRKVLLMSYWNLLTKLVFGQ